MNGTREEHGATLRIGAIARLTGVSVHTLRKWEERYGAVSPRRTEGGERVYTQTDLERLGLMKRLADAGLSLRAIAPLSREELEQAWQDVTSTAQSGRRIQPVRVAVLGNAVAAMLTRQLPSVGAMQVVASAGESSELEGALGGASIDVLIYDCPTVRHGTQRTVTELLERHGAAAAVVVYRFGARSNLLALEAPNIATVRAPADVAALEQAAVSLVHVADARRAPEARSALALQADADAPPPRLSREVIARVALSAPRMRCECPHHLADLVLSLRAFEDYSAECESANPEDAALHHFLWRSAANARALFEDAIERVAEAEGIDLRP